MQISKELQKFIEENIQLIEENTKDSWEEVYENLANNYSDEIFSEFAETILELGINDPAGIMEFIPSDYLSYSSINSYEIPDNVKSIGYKAFVECDNLTSIKIPGSVDTIGGSAFHGCRNLTSVVMDKGVQIIETGAFDHCIKLTKVVLPNSITYIERVAFYNCKELVEIQFTGTKKEARNMLKEIHIDWKHGSAIQKIVCTDGVIEL